MHRRARVQGREMARRRLCRHGQQLANGRAEGERNRFFFFLIIAHTGGTSHHFVKGEGGEEGGG